MRSTETNEATARAATSTIFLSIDMSPFESEVDFVALPMSKCEARARRGHGPAQTRRISGSDYAARGRRRATAVPVSNRARQGPRGRPSWLERGLCPIVANVPAADKPQNTPIFSDEARPAS